MIFNKKILIVSECFYPEQSKANDIAIEWLKKGFEVDILTLAPTYPLNLKYLSIVINSLHILAEN